MFLLCPLCCLSSEVRAVVQAQLLKSYILKPTLLYHVVPGVAAMVGALIHNRGVQNFWVIDKLITTSMLLSFHALSASKVCTSTYPASWRCTPS